jgi:hypothetical protein
VAQGSLEEGLVDAPVEDGNAQLHAPADHLLALHVKLFGKLGRGEVIGHGRTSLVVETQVARNLPLAPNVSNGISRGAAPAARPEAR